MSQGIRSILVVEDDRTILKLLRDTLESDSVAVHTAENARSGLIEAASRRPDLVILDLGLPDLDGKEFLSSLRSWSDCPVLVLSARTEEAEKVRALDRGADDFLTKPFGVPELQARIRALGRRRSNPGDGENLYKIGDVLFDLSCGDARRGATNIHLTPVEIRLLSELVKGEGRLLTQSQLLREVWGRGHEADSHYLRIFMANLRRKLEPEPANPRFLLTEIGVGCRCLCERLRQRD